jgi:hypothetical protein
LKIAGDDSEHFANRRHFFSTEYRLLVACNDRADIPNPGDQDPAGLCRVAPGQPTKALPPTATGGTKLGALAMD